MLEINLSDLLINFLADNSSPMSPPIVNSYSPQQNNLCDQNQVTSTLDNQQAQDLQQNPMSPMPQTQVSQPPAQPQSTEMSNMEQIGVGIQPQIVDPMSPYRRSGKNGKTTIQKLGYLTNNVHLQVPTTQKFTEIMYLQTIITCRQQIL